MNIRGRREKGGKPRTKRLGITLLTEETSMREKQK